MAIQWVDPGGEYYFGLTVPTQVLASSVINWEVSAFTVNNAPAGRSSLYAWQVSSQGNIEKFLASNFAGLVAGFAFYANNSNWTNNFIVMQFLDGASQQVEVRTDANGHLFLTRNGTQIGSTSSTTLQAGWQYIELKVTFATGATGSAEVKVNGVVLVTIGSVQTSSSGNAYGNRVYYNACVSGYIKDMYVLDTGTGVNTTYLGDINVLPFYPNGAGVNSAWTPLSSTNFSQVQDGINHTGTWPDGDTTYVSSSTVGNQDDYAHQAASITGTILGVQHMSYIRKDDANTRQIQQYVLSSGVQSFSSTQSVGNSYIYYTQVIENDPNTSTPWTQATFNAATFGVKVIA